MTLKTILKIANELDSRGLKIAANAVDMAVVEAANENIGIANVLHKFANVFDKHGQAKVADTLDLVITALLKTARTSPLYDSKKHHREELFQAFKDEADTAVEPYFESWRNGAHPLLTRYSPDYPGVMMQRLSDGVYQDMLSKKVYDFAAGFISDTGKRYYGGSVSEQTPSSAEWMNTSQVYESKHLQSRPQ